MTPALAKLVSAATLPRRSKTVTSWPSRASSHAVVTPITPAPITATRISARTGQQGFDRQADVEHRVVGERAGPHHQADGQLAARLAGQAERAAVEQVDDGGVAQQQAVDGEEGLVVGEQRLE